MITYFSTFFYRFRKRGGTETAGFTDGQHVYYNTDGISRWFCCRYITAVPIFRKGKGIMNFSDDASGFVSIGDMIPDELLDMRYYSSYNFVGERIDGYEEPAAILTREAAEALKAVSDEAMGKGYRLRIFDAYRPQKAVEQFMRWAADPDDVRMKPYFYPAMEKKDIIPLGFVARHSTHTRGSTVDLTLFDMDTQQEIDVGGKFDFFGERSHFDFEGVSEVQHANRMLLRNLMVKHGFRPINVEWWHFTLMNEPWPDTYFTFPVRNRIG